MSERKRPQEAMGVGVGGLDGGIRLCPHGGRGWLSCVCLRADVTCVTVRWPQRVSVVSHTQALHGVGAKKGEKTDLVSFQQHNL